MGWFVKCLLLLGFLGLVMTTSANGAVSKPSLRKLNEINNKGPYLGVVIPNAYEMNPLILSSSFVPDYDLPFLDFSGRRFRFGTLENEKVILVMTGLSMLNAGIATELLLSLFYVKGVVSYGIAGNANPDLQIGDVVIPRYWAHTGLWNWQRYGDGPDDLLAFEANGDYTREIGYLNISDHNNGCQDNLLNSVWYQPEEIFPVNGVPEMRQHAFWVPVDAEYYALADKLKDLKFESCVNSTCLPRTPQVFRVEKGCTANVLVDNASYRESLYSKFGVTPIDMESAAVALICHQHQTPFIIIRSLSDLAGGGSAQSNEAEIFSDLAAQNSVTAVLEFIRLLRCQDLHSSY